MILVLLMWVWAVSESEGMAELSNRNKQHISGFQGSCNPTIKLIFPKQGISSLLTLSGEEIIYETHAIELESETWLELNEKWYLVLPPLYWNYILALKMRLSWCLVCPKSQNGFLGLNGFQRHGQNFLSQGLGYWMWCISFFCCCFALTSLIHPACTVTDSPSLFPCIVTPKNWFKHQISTGDLDSKITLCGSNHCISLFSNPQTSFVTSAFRRTESYFIYSAFLF